MHDLSLYLLEVIENSVRAGATTVATTIVADRGADTLTIVVVDDGPGLPVPSQQALDPFFTTKRGKKTGLGLSLFRQEAEAAGGGLEVGRSAGLGGTEVKAWMGLAHVDRPPLGDIAATLATMVVTNPTIEFTLDLLDGQIRRSVSGRDLPDGLQAVVAYQETVP